MQTSRAAGPRTGAGLDAFSEVVSLLADPVAYQSRLADLNQKQLEIQAQNEKLFQGTTLADWEQRLTAQQAALDAAQMAHLQTVEQSNAAIADQKAKASIEYDRVVTNARATADSIVSEAQSNAAKHLAAQEAKAAQLLNDATEQHRLASLRAQHSLALLQKLEGLNLEAVRNTLNALIRDSSLPASLPA